MTDAAGLIPVPSGQVVTLLDTIWNEPGPSGLTFRFRFLAPGIGSGGGIDYDTAFADMLALCQAYVVPKIADVLPQPEQVIISFSDRPLPFGAADPEATQYFEAFSIQDGHCILEAF
ncbi:DUF6497 family protein [Cereibacter azotoformans]|uniref:Acetolactate synthase n=1 Tax=Cereibacter azotoformans TaxID=43057 RepID=A0A2T5KC60_9RHOB|nr:DUF6497 family protein [Cereibacter azotoformans]AXQ94184.1 acetolactate synthase [Cereibacter sphaeroides]MBO4168009.1 acetolactate synthase [Cereibacter azotoformans]PTR19942.1 hypothetical protein C8J28_10366 [Cereibacter azotoformans]UIJ29721.1 DUF6497 family protein [Cereibacter azotoformans]